MPRRMTKGERNDLIALELAERPPCTRNRIDRDAGKRTRQRAERRGHLAQDPEYTDCVVLTLDGADYLAVLREPHGS